MTTDLERRGLCPDPRLDHRRASDETGDEGAGRTAIHLFRRADLLDAPAAHDHDAVRHAHRLFLVMRDHDGGHAKPALQRSDFLAQMQPDDGIQRGERLIEQQQPGLGRERAGKRDTLLLPTGELRWILPRMLCQADKPNQLIDPGVHAVAAPGRPTQSVGDILRHRQIRE